MSTPLTPLFPSQAFRKASKSSPDLNCVRIAGGGGWVEIRDDKLDGTPYYTRVFLRLTQEAFDDYQRAVRDADSPDVVDTPDGGLIVRRSDDDHYEFRVPGGDVVLVFTRSEVDAFHDGIRNGEFALPLAVTG